MKKRKTTIKIDMEFGTVHQEKLKISLLKNVLAAFKVAAEMGHKENKVSIDYAFHDPSAVFKTIKEWEHLVDDVVDKFSKATRELDELSHGMMSVNM